MERHEIYEGLTHLFTGDPVNWIKWGVVFAVLILSYIPVFKLDDKVTYALSRERKADEPKALGQVLKGRLVQERNTYKDDERGHRTYWCHAKYEYTLHEETKLYRALFKGNGAPGTLNLYYRHPHRVFAVDDYHWENHKGCVILLVRFLPWILAALTGVLLKIPGMGN